MAAPDFTRKTVDLIAKRCAYKCANPDCRVSTVGPNSAPDRATICGEAAHIFGARASSKRYVAEMSDVARAQITNAIWLCRNCHKLVDSDESRFSSNLLFKWREEHERFVLADLGNTSDQMLIDDRTDWLLSYGDHPPIVKRILVDRPDGWEWSLAAVLMRFLNAPHFRRIRDLREGLYVKSLQPIPEDEIFDWVSLRLGEANQIAGPIEKLMQRLTTSFGAPGETGDPHEIRHICQLISEYIAEVIGYEESLYFADIPKRAEGVVSLLKDCTSSQVEKLENIPDALDEVIELIGADHGGTEENPTVISRTITFELPDDWGKKMDRALRLIAEGSVDSGSSSLIKAVFFVLLFTVTSLILFF